MTLDKLKFPDKADALRVIRAYRKIESGRQSDRSSIGETHSQHNKSMAVDLGGKNARLNDQRLCLELRLYQRVTRMYPLPALLHARGKNNLLLSCDPKIERPSVRPWSDQTTGVHNTAVGVSQRPQQS